MFEEYNLKIVHDGYYEEMKQNFEMRQSFCLRSVTES